MRWAFRLLAGVAALMAVLALLAYGPGSMDARRFDPTPPAPRLEALFTDPAEPELREGPLHGAEDLEPGPDGRLHASLGDGRVMARSPGGDWEEVAHTGGRPLGLAFDPEGRLVVADALRGLIRLEPDGDWTTIAEPGAYPDLVFTDDLTVLADGTIILSDASGRYGYGEYLESFWEGEQTGRVFAFRPGGGREVLMDGLAFANGVTHDPQSGEVFIAETWAARVLAVDPATAEKRIVIDGLPGYPDNLHWDDEERLLWIAMPSLRSGQLEFFHPRPFLKRLLRRFTDVFGEPDLPDRPVMALAVDRRGEPVRALLGPADGAYGATTAVPWEGRLWIGGLERETIDAYAIPERLESASVR
ncbi:SMP-30/gluconolactonase/LRE family protein [Glycocaulis profundi]|nr:SMP-30/gluconolactonase/LRE family protein [Glycocaulis profundi]